MKRMPVGELLRLACIYAERDQEEYVRCVEDSDKQEAEKARAFVRQLRAYRVSRWGPTRLESLMGEAKMTPVSEVFALIASDQPFGG